MHKLFDSFWRLFLSLYRLRTEANLIGLSLPWTYLRTKLHIQCPKRTESGCGQSKHPALFARANLLHFHHMIHGSPGRQSKDTPKPECGPVQGKACGQQPGKGLDILDCSSSSTSEKLHTGVTGILCHLRGSVSCHLWKMGIQSLWCVGSRSKDILRKYSMNRTACNIGRM